MAANTESIGRVERAERRRNLRRVAVTGIGLIGPIGNTVREVWAGAVAGRSSSGRSFGYGLSSDAHHITAHPENGHGARRSMMAALADAGLAPEDIGYVNAHATSTPLGDRAEALAILNAFGDHARSGALKVSATKSMTGHLLGAAAAFEAGLTLMALATQTAPPTINLEVQDPEVQLDCVPHHAAACCMCYALSNSVGFGRYQRVVSFRR